MKYKFLNLTGQIIETNNLSTIKKGLTWEKLNNYKPIYQPNKAEWEFIKRYSFYPSVWNFGVLQHLNLIYLTQHDYNRVKGGLS
jgi:hypothetical protein